MATLTRQPIVRYGSIAVMVFYAESGRWPPSQKAVAVDVS